MTVLTVQQQWRRIKKLEHLSAQAGKALSLADNIYNDRPGSEIELKEIMEELYKFIGKLLDNAVK